MRSRHAHCIGPAKDGQHAAEAIAAESHTGKCLSVPSFFRGDWELSKRQGFPHVGRFC